MSEIVTKRTGSILSVQFNRPEKKTTTASAVSQ